MDDQGKRGFSIRLSGTAQTLLGTLTIALLIWLSGFLGGKQGWIGDPAGDAEAAYNIILAQIEEEDSPTADVREAPLSYAGADMRRPSLNRDLFAADTKFQRPVEPAVSETKPKERRVRLPELSAVFIDGSSRQAVLSGSIAGVGEVVGGFTLLEIGNGWVKVEGYGAQHTITMESH